MASFGNQYSFIIAAVAIFLIAAYLLPGRKARWQEFLSLGVIGLGLVLAWIVLHPVQTPLVGDAQKVQAMIGQGKPVLLEFQSPYCLGCTRMKPIIDKLEAENKDTLVVVHLNVQDPAGRELGMFYGFKFTPTFIFFDAKGDEVWRSVGSLDPERVSAALP